MKIFLIAGVTLMLAAPPLSATLRAQTPPGPAPQQAPEPGNMTPADVQRLFDAYIVVESERALELSDSQYPQFIAKLRSLQDARRRNQQERNQLMQRLQRLTAPRAPTVDTGMIEGVLKSLQELESRNAAEMRKAYDDLDQVLDVRQRGRFRVLEEMVERRKIELLMRARQQNRPVRPKIQQ
jgi:hypothetical protein